MTHACCPACRMRFLPLPARQVTTCPHCDGPLAQLPAAHAMGYSLAETGTVTTSLSAAVAAALGRPADHLT